jgi:heme-degrading monooxygenase HmoA
MNYKVRPGKEETFEKAFRNVLEAIRAAPGHTESRLFREVDDPTSYLIISDWSDRKAFEGFVASPEFARVTSWGKENILRERPRHEIYEPNAASKHDFR